jgi:hypothetical protein
MNEYSTSDITLIQALLWLRRRPVRTERDGKIDIYVFDYDECKEDIEDLLANADKQVSIRDVWAGMHVWKMNIRRSRT